ncbi:hypothetical protein Mal4_53130 [Maioricimonas rarisocia]|uniref:Uncharacterized protein n=1 Tax=Maioricimonas rarisocia TaxID=2528026 RepID=A0A517ZEP3_9PLAN|nr:hypothetical protein [Maioricimonas rarisocia]QDU40950.1 hypothetical protein Mal4_53130 [Maioricimonas rarisocia]
MSSDTRNVLLEPVEYKVTETPLGTWRRHLSTSNALFEEFTSHAHVGGLPLLHFTRGKSPETGKRKTARGIIAVGGRAVGVLAVGQIAWGVVAIGQVAVGMVFSLGQAAFAAVAIGQLSIAVLFAAGQLAAAPTAIGQIAAGQYVLAQYGVGEHVWDMRGADAAAQRLFGPLIPW